MASEKIIFEILLDNSQAEKKIEENNARLREAREERNKLNKSVKDGSVDNEQYGRSVTKLNREIKDLSSENRVLEKTIGATENSVEGLRNKLSALTDAGNKLDIGTSEFKAVQKEIKETSDQLKTLEEERGDFRRSVGDYAKALGPLGGAFEGLGTAIQAGLGPLVILTGLATGIAKLFQFTQALAKTREEVNLLTGATGAGLDQITAKVQATADTFESDFSETLLAANAVAQGFGITVEQATDKIQKGFALGADASGELLPTLTEYSRLLGEVGVNADETIAIISQSTKDGVFSDKGVDAIKEASIRLREFTPATQEALDAIGISSKELQKNISDGTITSFEAIQQVSAKLGEFPEQSKEVGQAIADIFGGAGEDAGIGYLKTIKDIESNLDEATKSAGGFADANLRIADANEEINLLFNQIFGSAGDGFKDMKAAALEFAAEGLQTIISGIEATINYFIDLRNESMIFRGVIEGLKFAFNFAFEAIKNNIVTIIDVIKSVGKVIKAVLTGDFDEIPGIVREATEKVKQNFTEFGKTVAEDFGNAVKNTLSEDKVEPFKLLPAEQEEVAETYAKAQEKVREVVQVDRLLQLEDQKAFIQKQLLEVEKGTLAELELKKKLLAIERDIILENDELTGNQRLLAKAEFFAESMALDAEFAQLQIEQEKERLERELETITDNEERKRLLARQSLLNQEIDLLEFNERLFEIRQEALEAEIEQFAEGSIERIEREVELEELRVDRLAAIKKREEDISNTLKDTEVKNNEARFASARVLADGVKAIAGENTQAAKIAAAVSKGIALGEIVLNLQRQLTANAAAGAKISAAGAPVTVPAGIAYTASRNALAIAQAAVSGAKVATSAFDQGGIAFDGGNINGRGGMITGRSHQQGGVKFNMGGGRIGEADGKKGEAYIVNTRNNPYLKSIASKINVAGGGRSFFNDGGVVKFNDGGVASRVISADVLSEAQNRDTILDVISQIPAPVVGIREIISESDITTKIENLATI